MNIKTLPIGEAVLASNVWMEDLMSYLKDHEGDIAYRINDFGELRTTWDMFFPDPPEKD